jgi:hypothetical protein
MMLLGACAVASATAQDCTVEDFRIVNANAIALRCSELRPHVTGRRVRVIEVDAAGIASRASISGDAKQDEVASRWLDVALASDLKTGKKYVVLDPGDNPAFAPITISTEAAATISLVENQHTNCTRQGKLRLLVQSQIAYSTAAQKGTLTIQDGKKYPIELTQSVTTGLGSVGEAQACLKDPGTDAGQVRNFTIDGLTNIFGEAVQAAGAATGNAAPADKTSASYYIQLDAQAGEGQKPGYTVQATVAPTLGNVGAGWYFTPSADIDMGFSKADDPTTTTNMIKLGAGLSRYFAGPRVKFDPALQYETDRHGNHRNLLFNGEAQYFGRWWRRSIAQRDFDEYIRRLNPKRDDVNDKPVPKSPDEVHVAHAGYLFELLGGVEAGGALSSDTAQSSNGATSVVVPTYSVARFKPTLSLTGEYRRASLSLQAVPRYLFTQEWVTREKESRDPADATKSIRSISARTIDSWRVFATATFLWKLDPAGHFAWSVMEKIGSESPNFDHVNQVQTGLVILY